MSIRKDFLDTVEKENLYLIKSIVGGALGRTCPQLHIIFKANQRDYVVEFSEHFAEMPLGIDLVHYLKELHSSPPPPKMSAFMSFQKREVEFSF